MLKHVSKLGGILVSANLLSNMQMLDIISCAETFNCKSILEFEILFILPNPKYIISNKACTRVDTRPNVTTITYDDLVARIKT